jgi:hypothetical protein
MQMVALLRSSTEPLDVEEIAAQLNAGAHTETLFKVARHLVANGRLAVEAGATVFDDRYSAVAQS